MTTPVKTEHIFAAALSTIHNSTGTLISSGFLPPGIDQSRITVEPPRDPSHGDWATNVAMVLAKEAGRKPREIADAYAEQLRKVDSVASAEVAGPGFINVRLRPEV